MLGRKRSSMALLSSIQARDLILQRAYYRLRVSTYLLQDVVKCLIVILLAENELLNGLSVSLFRALPICV